MINVGRPTSAVSSPHHQNPNGELDGRQLRFLGDAIAPYGEAGCADITTRAAIQLRGIPLDGADKIITGLWDVGMTSLQTGRSIVWSDVIWPRNRASRQAGPLWSDPALH